MDCAGLVVLLRIQGMEFTAPDRHLPPKQIRRKCVALVIEAAEKWKVAPALIVAHCRCARVCWARAEVMQAMFRLGLKRYQIAAAFGRDQRRVRASVIGGPPRNPHRMEISY